MRAGVGLLLLLGSLPAAAQLTNDECAQAVPVPVLANCSTPVNGTVQGATQSLPPAPACSFGGSAQDAWYSFVATTSSHQITLAPRFSAVLDVRSGTCTSSASVFCTNVFSGNTQPTLVPSLSVGQTYFIRVYANGFTPPAGMSAPAAVFGVVTVVDVQLLMGGVCARIVSL